MKAAVYHRYGPPEVLQVMDVPRPKPAAGEILVKVWSTTVTAGDVRLRKADPFLARFVTGLVRPGKQILGVDMAGVVESTGAGVTRFQPGDAVFGSTGMRFGAYAEYACLPEDAVLVRKPEHISFDTAAVVFFGGHSALHFLREGGVAEGKKVLVYGASGSLGTYAVQLAAHFGAEVYGVCSTSNVELVRSLGARRVFDYTKEDFSAAGIPYDIIFDTVGKSPFRSCVASLAADGRYVRSVHIAFKPMIAGLWTNMTTRKKVIGGVAGEFQEDLQLLCGLVSDKTIRPVIDKVYPLDEIVEAHRYVESGHKKGNVVIRVCTD